MLHFNIFNLAQKHRIFNGPSPASFCLFLFFSNNLQIQTRIVGEEGKRADHSTTTTAHNLVSVTWTNVVNLLNVPKSLIMTLKLYLLL